ncbi:hypothetical protein MHK_001493, partial [Candidatus Magnetomorum sp. HK-1]
MTSAHAGEQSYRGPEMPYQSSSWLRDGDLFMSALFDELAQGKNLHVSFRNAVVHTKFHTDSGISIIYIP